MKIIPTSILLLFVFSFARSQTIINAEKLMGGADSTIYSLNFSYNGTSGNSSTTQLDISPAVVFIKDKNDIKLFGGYHLLAQSNINILNGGFLHIRHNYKISEKLKTFEFYQLQFDEVLFLQKREVFGAGLKIELANKKNFSTNMNVGLMREMERIDVVKLDTDEESESITYRATIVNSLKVQASKKIRFDNVIYYQPAVRDISDFRLLNEFSMSVAITDYLALLSTVSARYDSQPPGSLKNFDNLISLGVSIKF